MMSAAVELRVPNLEFLPAYKEAIERNWSPNTSRSLSEDELDQLHNRPQDFIRKALGEDITEPVILPDGSKVPRLPGFERWIWDGEFCGNIGFRWQKGTSVLPDYCMGHVGYSVVPWKQKRGYAKEALRLLLQEIKYLGLTYIEITTDPDNIASQQVILRNRGRLLGEYKRPKQYGDTSHLRYRIDL